MNNDLWIPPHTGVINRRTGEYTVFHDRWVSKVYWQEQGTIEPNPLSYEGRFQTLNTAVMHFIQEAVNNAPDHKIDLSGLVVYKRTDEAFPEFDDIYIKDAGGVEELLDYTPFPDVCKIADAIKQLK